jgi:hypothetical protein
MTCAVCGVSVRPTRHDFFEGDPQRPVRRWSIAAPLYFRADETFTRVVAPLCGPVCSAIFRLAG